MLFIVLLPPPPDPPSHRATSLVQVCVIGHKTRLWSLISEVAVAGKCTLSCRNAGGLKADRLGRKNCRLTMPALLLWRRGGRGETSVPSGKSNRAARH